MREIKRLEAAGDYQNPRYLDLLMPHHYVYHVLRMPAGRMARSGHARVQASEPESLHSDAGAQRAGRERQARAMGSFCAICTEIDVPTLTIGARHDTMDPAYMQAMAREMKRGRYLDCPDGSHLSDV